MRMDPGKPFVLLLYTFFISVEEDKVDVSVPLKMICPEVSSSIFIIKRPVVVFPQPDSPIRAKISPFFILKVTPSTAFTHLFFTLENFSNRSS